MNALSKEGAIVIGKGLSLPDVVLKIIEGSLPTLLIDYFSTPMVFDLTDEEQEEYGFGKILPIWSSANGDLIFAYDFSNDDYFSFNWEGDVLERFSDWNDLIKNNVSRVMELVWDDQSETEVLDSVKEIFNLFEIDDIESIFKSILES